RVIGFDEMQQLWPRRVTERQVVIVDIDEESLAKFGQWPWPRSLLAKLIGGIAAAQPRVLGIDLLFAEPDRLSPAEIPKYIPDLPPDIATALAALPTGEAKLAEAIAAVPTVLALAPTTEAAQAGPSGPRKAAPIMQKGEP